jgi:SAM-dependent methyltransferase
MDELDLEKAALRGEPSHVWRAGQERRLRMILDAAPELAASRVLEDGCGVGQYVRALAEHAALVVGLDIEVARLQEAVNQPVPSGRARYLAGVGERLPFPADTFDIVLSHEVLEHVQDDQAALAEIFRVLRPGGRLILFCPNRWYPFETHGIYWRGTYRFGNIPLVNYLPDSLRNRLAPHVRAYTTAGLSRLIKTLPVRVVCRRVIFGAYDNIIARHSRLGEALRIAMQILENTPLQVFGLSHFWVIEKTGPALSRDPQTQAANRPPR